MGVSKQNSYTFGIAGSTKNPHLQACNLMRKFSEACGADYPTRLRGTNLRKQIATTCITLNLETQEISDLSNFMGHFENIHKGIYRQPILSREILGVSKLLELAQGVGDVECTDDDDDDDSEGETNNEVREISGQGISANESCSLLGSHNDLKSKKNTTKASIRYGTSKKARWTNDGKMPFFVYSANTSRRKRYLL